MKVLTTFKFTEDEFKSIRDLGYEIVFKDEKTVTFTEDIKDIDILITFDCFSRLDIDMLPNLKWIQLLSAGINQVPEDKIRNRNILLTNSRGVYSIPIAEWIVLKTLEMYKNSKEFHEKQRNKIWKPNTHLLELYGKTIGFIGTGSIAQEAAKRFEGFGVRIIGINTTGKEVKHFHECYNIDRINEAVGKCDVVVITVPYTDKTYHLVNKNVLDSMKDGAYIINIARGVIIDEPALIESLKSGKIKKAALDVFEKEPLPENSPLWEMDNVYISPHNSWSSEMVFRRRYEIAYNNLKRYRDNEELINVIDLNKGY